MANIIDYYTDNEKDTLASCNLCPRACKRNRLEGEVGFCGLNAGLNVALVCLHRGEEPILSGEKGICNVFFSHCNCQCVFCQNHKISQNFLPAKNLYDSVDSVVDAIIEVLAQSENILGFVSPSHQVPAMKVIIRELNRRGHFPKIVYNSNGYDSVETLQGLEDIVDIYLPDYKYTDNNLAAKYSKTNDYADKTLLAIKEMYRQKGSTLLTDENDLLERGLIIRHLVLPGHIEESKNVLDTIAWELSPNVCLSIMSQYTPPYPQKFDNLNRQLTIEEYQQVEECFYQLGFHKGYLQELSSTNSCLPDFDNNRFINQP